RAGNASPGLSALIAGSFHRLITPVKILAITSPDRRRLVTRRPLIFRLYMKAVPPATIGMYADGRLPLESLPAKMSRSPDGIPDTPKSALPSRNWVRPWVEPAAWYWT